MDLTTARTLLRRALTSNSRRIFSSSCSRQMSASNANTTTSSYNFLSSNYLPPKPRDHGLTEIRGPYYYPVTQTYLDELLSDWGEFVDGRRGLIETAYKHDIYVSTGGFIEKVLSSSNGNREVMQYFDVLEISSGFLSIPTDDWADLAEMTAKAGLKPKPEVGIQWGAGGDASIAELESAGTRDPKWLIDRAKTFLEAGAYMIMIESEGITENVRNWRTDVISAVTSALPKEKIMFEAADPEVFAYHIQNQGATANLFVDHSQIVQLACLRKGIWGTGSTFGKIVTVGKGESAGSHRIPSA
ncbi:MAG: coma-domain-containing protein [Lentinula lateritia]|nr:MAG: coma-domain-containing protein [Lentinula lateritia]